mgnify:CR=1 FL=1
MGTSKNNYELPWTIVFVLLVLAKGSFLGPFMKDESVDMETVEPNNSVVVMFCSGQLKYDSCF